MALKKSVLLLLTFSILIFLSALSYVEQQLRLQRLNYEIIELKKQKRLLVEQQKTSQLQLDQLRSLERIEREVKRQGFVPIGKEQLRIVR
jgi:response regulator of citrate/malate metabolism